MSPARNRDCFYQCCLTVDWITEQNFREVWIKIHPFVWRNSSSKYQVRIWGHMNVRSWCIPAGTRTGSLQDVRWIVTYLKPCSRRIQYEIASPNILKTCWKRLHHVNNLKAPLRCFGSVQLKDLEDTLQMTSNLLTWSCDKDVLKTGFFQSWRHFLNVYKTFSIGRRYEDVLKAALPKLLNTPCGSNR